MVVNDCGKCCVDEDVVVFIYLPMFVSFMSSHSHYFCVCVDLIQSNITAIENIIMYIGVRTMRGGNECTKNESQNQLKAQTTRYFYFLNVIES